MKKLILSLCLTIISLLGFSQTPTKVVSVKNCVGYYNPDSEKYDFQPITESVITFSIYKEYVSVDDESHSIYRIVEYLPKKINKDNQIISAKCLDEKNRNCIFAFMSQDDGSNSISVIYDNYMYIYFLN